MAKLTDQDRKALAQGKKYKIELPKAAGGRAYYVTDPASAQQMVAKFGKSAKLTMLEGMNESAEVAKEIIAQLGGNRAMFAIGAKNIGFGKAEKGGIIYYDEPHRGYVKFNVPKPRGATIFIILNPRDYYDVLVMTRRGFDTTLKKRYDDVDFERLPKLIEEITGMYLNPFGSQRTSEAVDEAASRVECMECGHVFKANLDKGEPKCPKCKSVDIELAEALDEAFYSDKELEPVYIDMSAAFNIGSLYSRSSMKQIIARAMEALQDNGFEPKKSLAIVVAKKALASWMGEIDRVKKELDKEKSESHREGDIAPMKDCAAILENLENRVQHNETLKTYKWKVTDTESQKSVIVTLSDSGKKADAIAKGAVKMFGPKAKAAMSLNKLQAEPIKESLDGDKNCAALYESLLTKAEEVFIGHDEAAMSPPDKHQLKILKDTVKNPLKGKFLGGPSAEESEKILKEKFKFTDKQIQSLKREGLDESSPVDDAVKRSMRAKKALTIRVVGNNINFGYKGWTIANRVSGTGDAILIYNEPSFQKAGLQFPKNDDDSMLNANELTPAKIDKMSREYLLKNYFPMLPADTEIVYYRRGEEVWKESFDESNLSPKMVKDYEARAAAERKAGGKVKINHRLPSVAVDLSDGSEYFFQGDEASDLLDEVPDNIDAEDYILAVAQGW